VAQFCHLSVCEEHGSFLDDQIRSFVISLNTTRLMDTNLDTNIGKHVTQYPKSLFFHYFLDAASLKLKTILKVSFNTSDSFNKSYTASQTESYA
jgi:hypothetical protein